MLNVVVVGAGPHCTTQHAPALVHFRQRHPGRVSLSAICDLNPERAERAQKAFGIERSFTSVEKMLSKVKADAAIAPLPHTGKLSVLEQFMKRRIPLVMEKPLGADLTEAQTIVRTAERFEAPVMVSLNRRFDPALLRAKAWLADRRPMRYLVGSMLRVKRTESFFIWGTGVHLLDAMVALAGPLELACPTDVHRPGDYGCIVTLRGRDDLVAVAEILPVTGRTEERLRIVGDDTCVDIWTGSTHPWSVKAFQAGELVLDESGPADEPLDLRNGTYNETEAFLLAVLEGRPLPAPSIAHAMVATDLAARLQTT